MLYTSEQLLQIYDSPQSGWIMVRNDDIENPSADVSRVVPAGGAIESDGVWKIHISIAPQDMVKALPILRAQFCDPSTPKMGMKVASRGLLAEDHQSGKAVALIFDRATEESKEGQEKILFFLRSLAIKFEAAGIVPEEKPPLTVETEACVRRNGTAADKKNLARGKYDATIRFRENEVLSYFNYRDEMALIFEDGDYAEMAAFADLGEQQRMLKRSDFDQSGSLYKHNPLKRNDDFLYGVVLERRLALAADASSSGAIAGGMTIQAATKEDFLTQLQARLQAGSISRAGMLDIFKELKNKEGRYSFIHQQKNPRWDSIRLFFKSRRNPDEYNFWHTATYQKAVKLLKEAYVARVADSLDESRQVEADALIDYVRGNSPIHFQKTSTRKCFK